MAVNCGKTTWCYESGAWKSKAEAVCAVGPRLGNSPVPSIVQCLARKDGTDDFYQLKVSEAPRAGLARAPGAGPPACSPLPATFTPTPPANKTSTVSSREAARLTQPRSEQACAQSRNHCRHVKKNLERHTCLWECACRCCGPDREPPALPARVILLCKVRFLFWVFGLFVCVPS